MGKEAQGFVTGQAIWIDITLCRELSFVRITMADRALIGLASGETWCVLGT